MKIITLLLFILLFGCKEENNKINHEDFLTIDTHIDIPLKLVRDSTYNLSEKHTYENSHARTDFPRMNEGGLDAAVFAVWTAQGERTEIGNLKAKNKALKLISAIKSSVNKSKEAELAFTVDDIYKVNNSGKHPILMGMENGYPIGNNISLVDSFYNLGIRYITLCHVKDNDICDSSTDESEDNGITPFGKGVIKRMNKLGIIIDVSHVSDSTFFQVLQLSKTPVLASHSNARALCNHPRNMTDKMLKALAENGGVIDVNFVDNYLVEEKENPQLDSALTKLKLRFSTPTLSHEKKKEYLKLKQEIEIKFGKRPVNIDDVINHIDYIAKLIGVEHVGIGSDFDGGGGVEGLVDVSDLPKITAKLIKKGYTKDDIQKIWSGNFLRIFSKVENYAKKNR